MKRVFLLCLSIFLVLGTLSAASADIIGFTSFEEAATGGQYIDTQSADTDHTLTSNTAQASVNFTSRGGELGFSSHYISTGDVGLTDGDFVGVTDYTPVFGGSFPDGAQGFEMQDTDGIMVTTLDSVNLSGYTNTRVSMDFFINETGWESTDLIQAYLTVDGGNKLYLLDTTGSDIDDLGIEGGWLTASLNLDGYSSAQLSFLLESNAAAETLWIDHITFEGSPVPLPAAFWLLGSGLLGLVGLRKKMK